MIECNRTHASWRFRGERECRRRALHCGESNLGENMARFNCSLMWLTKVSFHLFQDLETYVNSYQGMAKLTRMMYIADHCPLLRIESLKTAISAVQETYNVSLYQQMHRKLQEAIVGYIFTFSFYLIFSIVLILIVCPVDWLLLKS